MPLKTFAPEEPTLNLTPMIDVILTLVIFFLVAARFTDAEKAIDLQVPNVSSRSALATAAAPKVVNVLADGRIMLGAQPISLDELVEQLKTAHGQYQKLSVLVRGDRGATHGRMTDVYDACRRAGINDVAVAVKSDVQRR
jgi:biopolymer transport protein ExbD